MTITHRLIALGLAFGLLGSTCAFAKPTPEREPAASHFRTAKTPDTSGYVHRSPDNPVKDNWPARMILGSYETSTFG
jgi:hypothetical protein